MNKTILTAGPSISYLEIDYGLDAIKNGWNRNHSDYVKLFEKTVAEYIGVKYAIATSSCTGALHLGLLAMGVGPEDEVIVPDISWIATASAVVYTGAKPIFCDVNKDTWVLDTDSIEKLITNKTKVVIPVHLYGNPVQMEKLLLLKEKYGFKIFEDAAPSFGTTYNNKKTGSFGDAAAFSFQGAKALVTGEGGIFLTNDRELYKKFRVLWDHGRDADNPRIDEIKSIGYKYKMSNLQAAIGLAQVERVEEIVNRKREIFDTYEEYLSDQKYITLNPRIDNSRQLFWMTSIVLNEQLNVSREEFINELKFYNIDSRPFFPPMSNYSMFSDNKNEYKNHNSEYIGYRGINLPSGHNITKEEIEYISNVIKIIISKYTTGNNLQIAQKTGWLLHQDNLLRSIRHIKNNPDYAITFTHNNMHCRLVPITNSSVTSADLDLLVKWRNDAQSYFPTQSKITREGTKNWLINNLDSVEDRLLFWIINENNTKVGHIGLFRFDFQKSHCELDNIIRGNFESKGIMESSLKSLISLVKNDLLIKNIFLRVFSDNHKAISLYKKLGFEEIQNRPLKKIINGESTRYIELNDDVYASVDRYFTTMQLK
jgi:perosamine synthetase